MSSSTIWLIQERKTRFGQVISEERLETLRNKRIRYLLKAIPLVVNKNQKKSLRLQSRLSYTERS